MQKIPSEIFEYITSIQRIEVFFQQIILYTEEGIYAYIPVCSQSDIYSYLNEIGFCSFYTLLNKESDSFQLFQLQEKKESHILSILGELYSKSTQPRSFSSLQVSSIYNRLITNIQRSMQFYYSVQDKIEEMLYPPKTYYSLLLDMSQIYHLLHMGGYFLNEWYQSHPLEYREVLTIRKIDSHNFWGKKIIDFSSSRKDYYIYEVANYYRMYYKKDSVVEEIQRFFQIISVTKQDLLLFYSLISYVEEFEWDYFEDEKTVLHYVNKTNSFLSKEYEEYQKGKEEMLEE